MKKEIIVKIRDWVLLFVESLLSILKVLLFSKFKRFDTTKIQKNHENCIILGNGPSLNDSIEQYKSIINNYDLICVNYFPKSEHFETLKPAIFVTAAPEFWIDDVDDNYKEKSKILFDALANKTNWKLVLFIPWEAKNYPKWQKQIAVNANISVVYFNPTPVDGFTNFRHLLFSQNLGMPRPQNVLIPSLMLSISMNYEKIYLLGADHNWLNEFSVDDNNNVLLRQKHFYDASEAKHLKMGKLGRGKRKMHEILHKFMHTFKNYHTIREYADSRNVKIINSTSNSFIDAFERGDIK
jgi:hypothetical protein